MKKRTIYSYVLSSFVLLTILIAVFMEIANIRSYYVKWSSEREIHEQTLTFYMQYWQAKFNMVDSSLLMMNTPEFNGVYSAMSAKERTLEFELAKQEFQDKIQQAINVSNNDFFIFYYNPERNIYLKGSTPEYTYAESMQIKNTVSERIESGMESENSGNWIVLDTGNNMYFTHIYSGTQGYMGAALDMQLIKESIEDSLDTSCTVVVTDGLDNVLLGEHEFFLKKSGQSVSGELKKAYCKVWIVETYAKLWGKIILFALHTFLMTAFVILACAIIIKGNIKLVLQPLVELQKGMTIFGIGDMSVRLKEKWEIAEIQDLYQAFNNMADKIKHLTVDVYGAQLERQRIEYNYLKIQIQPHFYSNILNLIYSLAEVRDCRSIQKLSMAMANYFRYLLSNKETLVSAQKELDCVENYMEIQKIRYPDCIFYQVQCKGDPQDFLMPPIVIQTFVENGVQHNITVCSPIKIIVQIDVLEEEQKVRIIIEDNGSGFEDETLRRLQAGEDISKNGKSIGIQNVIDRMEALYGHENCSIELKNKECGAMIMIEIPLVRRMEKNESIISR